VWQRPVGSGLAGVAVAKKTAVLFHRLGNREIVEAMNALSGQRFWRTGFPTDYVPSYTSDDGPRCVPIIHRGHVYVYGVKGVLRCLEQESGKQLWSRNTSEDFRSNGHFHGEPPEGYFGVGTSPLIVDDRIIVNVGGDASGAGVVAFSTETGATVWKSTGERASYSSPILATVDGVRHVVVVSRLNVLSLDPATGHVRFRFSYARPGPNVCAANPLVFDGCLFVSASYGFGAVFARIRKNGVEEIWKRDDLMSSQYTTCILHEGKLYGIHGRQDVGQASLRCFDPKSQKVEWSEENFGYATLVKAADRLIILTTDGQLILARLDPLRYVEMTRSRLFRTTTRALPALSDGLLFARDTDTLKCIDLRRKGVQRATSPVNSP